MYNIPCNLEENKQLELLISGCEKAFTFFYNRYESRIFKVALRYLKCEDAAQELVQDVFLKLWTKKGCLQIERPVEAWLYTVGKNEIFNILKRQANLWKVMNQLKQTHSFEDNSMQDLILDSDYKLLLKNTLNSLSYQQLAVFKLARYEEMSYSEIACKLNISPLTVKTHMSRALCFIRSNFVANKIIHVKN
ncbi:RNA polymerase sigma-70 factor [Pedobacter petrophilus]|uniref:RNA polymerase sigma-70 factor n=2 Tax=Pedobacter TaxID=84567 RepID=A0A7K0G2V2_9SPHI|nr:RNA polymerase sigma-70 factor [Pedobacter petrophilus]MRX78021.1 RNA polymerase sigma-70 factor [Pedobacter petrophilus]